MLIVAGDGICTGEGSGGGGSTGRCGTAGGNPNQPIPKGALPSKGGAPKSPKMGGMPKMGGEAQPPTEMKAVSAEQMDSWINSALAQEVCSAPEKPEKGHQAKGSEGAHMLYNKDGKHSTLQLL
jgi:hypothetical protein